MHSDTRAIRALRRVRAFVSHEIMYSARIVYYRLRYRDDSVFSVIYRTKAWGEDTSASGGGSELAETESLREVLPDLLRELDVRSMLDAPCGDFHWMSAVDLGLESYFGVDIVEPLIQENKERYETERVRFFRMDITKEQLPTSDLILCRDCMVHMSNEDIQLTLQNFKRSGARYLLATTYPGTVERNKNVLTGMWRYLDLQRPPFNFPPPLRLIDERTKEAYQGKSLGLWSFNQIL